MSVHKIICATQQQTFEDNGLIIHSPKQFEIEEIDAKLACKLNHIWHSRLPKIHLSNVVRNKNYVCFGFFYKGECFAVAIWSSPIAKNLDAGIVLELRRYAIKETAPRNTASWGLSKMIKLIKKIFPEITTLISYQDTNVHSGLIYKASNWIPKNITKFTSWSHKTRKRNLDQAIGDKIRWEFYLNGRTKLTGEQSTIERIGF